MWRKVKNQKKFHSALFFGKTKSFPKKSEYSIFGPFLPKLENYIHDYKNINFRNGSINTKMNKYMLTVCHAFSSKCTKDPKTIQLWYKTFHIFDVRLGYGIISTHFVKNIPLFQSFSMSYRKPRKHLAVQSSNSCDTCSDIVLVFELLTLNIVNIVLIFQLLN